MKTGNPSLRMKIHLIVSNRVGILFSSSVGRKCSGSVQSLKLDAFMYVVKDPRLLSFSVQYPNSSNFSCCFQTAQCI